jgi:hypothetical protein
MHCRGGTIKLGTLVVEVFDSAVQIVDFTVEGEVYQTSELFLKPVILLRRGIFLRYFNFIDSDFYVVVFGD